MAGVRGCSPAGCCWGGAVLFRLFLLALTPMKYTLTKRGKIVPLKQQPMKEDRVQTNCIRWFDIQYPKLSHLLFHIPNGGSRNIIEAVKFKRMGVRRGVADLFLSIPSKNYHGLYIEMKSQVGEQSDAQERFERDVRQMGYAYILCNNIDHFIRIIQEYLSHTPFHKKIWKQLAANGQ